MIRVSQWAEIRALSAEGVPKKAIARRLGVDVKTVRRVLGQAAHPGHRHSPRLGRRLDAVRPQVEQWLTEEPKLTAKRIGRLLVERGLFVEPIGERTLREFVAEVKAALKLVQQEAFIHRTHRPGATMEADFGETRAQIDGEETRLFYLVVTLPYSNAYFAKAYRVQRLECLLDGLSEAFRFFGGLPGRLVLDNASMVVKDVLRGRERVEQKRFEAWRGELGLHVDYCAPAKGNEKGSVEGGVKYVRNNCFRPMPVVDSLKQLNANIVAELERDAPLRPHPDGGSAADALVREREALRPLPARLPEACRVVQAKANKFAHVRVDYVTYSLPMEYARRAVTVKLFAEHVLLAVDDEVVAQHPRVFVRSAKVLDPLHVLDALERKHRAACEATALQPPALPDAYYELREAMRTEVRKADQEWVQVLQLLKANSRERVTAAVEEALRRGSPRLATVQQILRHGEQGPLIVEPVALSKPELEAFEVPPADLSAYDTLVSASNGLAEEVVLASAVATVAETETEVRR